MDFTDMMTTVSRILNASVSAATGLARGTESAENERTRKGGREIREKTMVIVKRGEVFSPVKRFVMSIPLSYSYD